RVSCVPRAATPSIVCVPKSVLMASESGKACSLETNCTEPPAGAPEEENQTFPAPGGGGGGTAPAVAVFACALICPNGILIAIFLCASKVQWTPATGSSIRTRWGPSPPEDESAGSVSSRRTRPLLSRATLPEVRCSILFPSARTCTRSVSVCAEYGAPATVDIGPAIAAVTPTGPNSAKLPIS